MGRVVVYIILFACGLSQLNGQHIDYPVDFELLKSAEITNFAEVNTENLEFSPTLYNDGVIYVASKPRGKKKQQITYDLKYYDLVKKNESTDFYEKDINDLHHFGPCAYDPNGKEIFFSENYTDKKGSDGRYHMKLIRAVYRNNDWEIIDDFPFNSHEYSILHPAISKDGKTLVFASKMPGGYGGMDLYSITKTENGWSLPINLGPEINSESNDVFPTFYGNDHIFYSSDGGKGLGGLDIFVCKYIDDEWRFPQSLGEPVNSKLDDIGFALSADASYGFFSSNRMGGLGQDDIYKFELAQPMVFDDLQALSVSQAVLEKEDLNTEVKIVESKEFQFLILDDDSNSAINSAMLSYTPLLSEEQKYSEGFKSKFIQKDQVTGKLKLLSTPNPSLLASKESLMSDLSGKVNVKLAKDQVYLVEISKSGFKNERTIIDVSEMMNESAMFISMSKVELKTANPTTTKTAKPVPAITNRETDTNSETNTKLKVPSIVGELLVFENLLYNYNEATIKSGGTRELLELADYMQKYPQLEVELSAHTDAIGSAPYNLNLSQKRAEVAKQFLVDQGIDGSRVVAKGYGERVIRNHCVEGVICTDDEHAYNRRTELKITKK